MQHYQHNLKKLLKIGASEDVVENAVNVIKAGKTLQYINSKVFLLSFLTGNTLEPKALDNIFGNSFVASKYEEITPADQQTEEKPIEEVK